jgi:hypothetical protein
MEQEAFHTCPLAKRQTCGSKQPKKDIICDVVYCTLLLLLRVKLTSSFPCVFQERLECVAVHMFIMVGTPLVRICVK